LNRPTVASHWAVMITMKAAVFAVAIAAVLPACVREPVEQNAAQGGSAEGTMPVKPGEEPERVVVQHILIAFEGSVPTATRSKLEAEKLASEVLARARKGEDFDALVRQYTDDSPPGIYAMANRGVAPDREKEEYARTGMVAAFGDVGFAISPGNIDMAPFHAEKSPFGWHIIKRLK